MPMVHDSTHRTQLIDRVRALRPDSQRRFGKMSVDQMLWHVNGALEAALGQRDLTPRKFPIPRPLLKFLVMNLPWGKGAPTASELVPSGSYDFEAERAKCIRLIDALSAKSMNESWSDHPAFGRMSGRDVSRLQAKHLNHHLRQFGV
jgi:hypothetical protein